jgi:hypothetical protein
MRLSLSLCCVLLALLTSACGKKKKSEPDTPQPNSGDVGPDKGTPGPEGKPGEQGPPGLPSGTLNYSVMDATGHVIGKTTWDHYVRFNDDNTFSMQLSDGAIFPVNPKDGTFAGGFCQYVSHDCTGSCLYSGLAGTRNKMILGSAGFYWLNSVKSQSLKSYASTWSVVAGNGNGSGQCNSEPSPISIMAVELPSLWTKPGEFTYPVPVPMDVSEIMTGLDEFEE